jgi:hypothetical protein
MEVLEHTIDPACSKRTLPERDVQEVAPDKAAPGPVVSDPLCGGCKEPGARVKANEPRIRRKEPGKGQQIVSRTAAGVKDKARAGTGKDPETLVFYAPEEWDTGNQIEAAGAGGGICRSVHVAKTGGEVL